MKRALTIALAIVTLLSLSVFAIPAFAATNGSDTTTAVDATDKSAQGGHSKKEKVTEPENAIGKDAAKALALKDAGISADAVEKIKAHVSKLDDGTVVYKVGFTAGNKYYSYKINALTGEVADKSEMSAEEHEAAKAEHKGNGRHAKKEEISEPENAIGKDAAKAAALKDAGLSADNVDRIRSRVTKLDDGTVVYKVGITVGDKYYSYKINALTGEIAEKSQMTVEEHEAAKAQRTDHGKKTSDSTEGKNS